MVRLVSEAEFSAALERALAPHAGRVRSVTGPGRSGAIASVYASHRLGVPFIPYGAMVPHHLAPLLIADTAEMSGATLRKALRRYERMWPVAAVAFHEPPRVVFWYEAAYLERIST